MSAKHVRIPLLILAALLIILAGCSSPYRGRYTYDVSLISEVSFVSVDSDGTIVTVESLESDQYASFFLSLSQLQRHEYWNDPIDIVEGSAILITFQDGNYHLINHHCTIRAIDGKAEDTLEFYGYEDFIELWEQYCSHDYILP